MKKRWLMAGGAVLVAGFISLAGVMGWLMSAHGESWLASRVTGTVNNTMTNGMFTMESLDLNGLISAEIQGVQFSLNGREVIGIQTVTIDVSLPQLLVGSMNVTSMVFDGVTVDSRVDTSGMRDLSKMFPSSEEPPSPYSGLGIDLSVDELLVRDLSLRTGLENSEDDALNLDLDLSARLRSEGALIALESLELTGLLNQPKTLPFELKSSLELDETSLRLGTTAWTGSFGEFFVEGTIDAPMSDSPTMGLLLSRSMVDLTEVDRVLGGVGIAGLVEVEGAVSGPLNALNLELVTRGVENSLGEASVSAVVDSTDASLPFKAAIELSDLQIGEIYPELEEQVKLNATSQIEGVLLSDDGGPSVKLVLEGKALSLFGVAVDGVDIVAEYDAGSVTITQMDIKGLLSELSVNGGFDTANGGLSQRLTGHVDLAGLRSVGVPDLTGRGWVDFIIKGDTSSVGSPIDLSGKVRFGRVTFDGQVVLTDLSGEISVEARGGAATVQATVQASGGDIYGAGVGPVRVNDLTVEHDGIDTVIRVPDFTIQSVGIDDLLDISGISGRADAVVPAHGEMRVNASLQVGPVNVEKYRSPGGVVEIGLIGDNLTVSATLDGPKGSEHPLIDFDGQMNLARQSVTLTRLTMAPTRRSLWRGDGDIEFTMVDGGVADVVAVVRSTDGVIRVEGGYGGMDAVSVALVFEGVDLAAIGDFRPDLGLRGGRLDADVELKGISGQLTGAGFISFVDLDLDEVFGGLSADVTFELGVNSGQVKASLHDSRGELLDLTADLPLNHFIGGVELDPSRNMSAVVTLHPASTGRLNHLLPQLKAPPASFSGLLEVEGLVADPAMKVSGVAKGPVQGWQSEGRIEFSASSQGRETTVWADIREGFSPRASLTGSVSNHLDTVISSALGLGPEVDLGDIGLYVNELDLLFALINVPAKDVVALSGSEASLEGDFVGGFEVVGPWSSPKVDGAVNWLDAKIGHTAIEGAYLGLYSTDAGYEVELSTLFTGGGELFALSSVPVEVDLSQGDGYTLTDMIQTEIQGREVPLALLEGMNIGIERAAGVIEFDGTISASEDRIIPKFNTTLKGGKMRVVELGLDIDEISAELVVDPDLIVLEYLKARTTPSKSVGITVTKGGTNVHLSGTTVLENAKPKAVAIDVGLQEAWLSATTAERVQVTGDIEIAGEWPKLSVTTPKKKPLRLDHGLLIMDAVSWMEAAPVTLDEAVLVHRSRRAQGSDGERGAVDLEQSATDEVDEDIAMFENIRVNVGLDLGRVLELQVSMPYIDDLGAFGAAVTRADMATRIDGELRYKGKEGRYSLLGEVRLVGGMVRVMQSQFDLNEGTFAFIGAMDDEPNMDIDATMGLSGGAVDMKISGTPSEPQIDLSSEEWPDQTQILTTLLTGRAPDEMSEEQGAATAGALAGLLINSVVGGARMGSISVDPDGSLRMVLPSMLQNVYGESVLNTNASVDEDSWAVELEWAIANDLILDTTVGEVNKSADLFWEYRW